MKVDFCPGMPEVPESYRLEAQPPQMQGMGETALLQKQDDLPADNNSASHGIPALWDQPHQDADTAKRQGNGSHRGTEHKEQHKLCDCENVERGNLRRSRKNVSEKNRNV